ncbi:MAG: 1-acyl-sn-glycerol-3-phosphate acyltransferase [Ferruginibacter sp.]
MLYRLLKFPARLAILIYCKHLKLNTNKYLSVKGPLLLAVNHPNSLLDAVILSTIFKQPIHSLARGDVFKKPLHEKFLRAINMHPVYRLSEGAENIEHNYTSFEACRNIFKENGIVLIFSEGRCENEWHLRPLMKGTARLALSAWDAGIPLKILPVGINYHSFISFGKNVQVNFGNIISQDDISNTDGFGKTVASFNNLLKSALQNLVYEIDRNDKNKIKSLFNIHPNYLKKIILFFPGMIGYIFHWPLYFPIQRFAWSKASGTGHYDSVVVALLFLLYPIYLCVLLLVFAIIFKSWWVLILLLTPFFAWSYVQWKKDKY